MATTLQSKMDTQENQKQDNQDDDIRKILVLFAHPALHLSKINKQLIKAYEGLENVTFHDLYETYPRFFINIEHEQKLLTEHDVIIFHYPLHWYNFPPLLKHWQDTVLTTDFVLSKDRALSGKLMLNVVTTGGTRESYQTDGRNRHEISEYLIHAEQAARICKMTYLPPFVIHNARDEESVKMAHKYSSYLRLTIESLQYLDDEAVDKLCREKYINDDLSVFIDEESES